VEPPQDLVGRELGQAFAQRGDEDSAGLVEVVGDELGEQRRVFGSQHRAQTRELILAVASLDYCERGPHEGLDHRFQPQARAASVGQQP
jgi:hypothetical protein